MLVMVPPAASLGFQGLPRHASCVTHACLDTGEVTSYCIYQCSLGHPAHDISVTAILRVIRWCALSAGRPANMCQRVEQGDCVVSPAQAAAAAEAPPGHSAGGSGASSEWSCKPIQGTAGALRLQAWRRADTPAAYKYTPASLLSRRSPVLAPLRGSGRCYVRRARGHRCDRAVKNSCMISTHTHKTAALLGPAPVSAPALLEVHSTLRVGLRAHAKTCSDARSVNPSRVPAPAAGRAAAGAGPGASAAGAPSRAHRAGAHPSLPKPKPEPESGSRRAREGAQAGEANVKVRPAR